MKPSKPKKFEEVFAMVKSYLGENVDLRDKNSRLNQLNTFLNDENRMLRTQRDRWRDLAIRGK